MSPGQRAGIISGLSLACCATAMALTHFSLSSPVFVDGARVPDEYTCTGADASPPLALHGTPPGTKSLALRLSDPDAPRGTFTHWLAWNLPADTAELRRGALPPSAVEGRNDFGKRGYGGPCPPPGKPHRYVFEVFALGAPLQLAPGSDAAAFAKVLSSARVLGEAKLVGLFSR